MYDKPKWDSAWALFQAYAKDIPLHFEEEHIKQYQAHLLELAGASGLFLNEFRIPPEEIKQREPQRGPLHFVSTRSTSGAYCDRDYALAKIEALRHYLMAWEIENRKGQPLSDNKDYWSMSDNDIEYLGLKYHIPIVKGGYLDRAGIIEALVKRDNALKSSNTQPGNSIHIGQMVGSAIQQASSGAVMHHNFQQNDKDLLRLLGQITDIQKTADLSPISKSQLTADVGTIESQLTSPHPNSSVITELLRSIKSIFESSAAGSLIAPHVMRAISKYIG